MEHNESNRKCKLSNMDMASSNFVCDVLKLKEDELQARECLKTGIIQVVLCGILLSILSKVVCWNANNAVTILLLQASTVYTGMNVILNFHTYFIITFKMKKIIGTKQQKKLLFNVAEKFSFFKILKKGLQFEAKQKSTINCCACYSSFYRWLRARRGIRSQLRYMYWKYRSKLHQQQQRLLQRSVMYYKKLKGRCYLENDPVTTKEQLQKYLLKRSLYEEDYSLSNQTFGRRNILIAKFWQKKTDDLKKLRYQSSTIMGAPPNNRFTSKQLFKPNSQSDYTISCLPKEFLDLFVYKLRVWFRKTILCSLMNEINNINCIFRKHCIEDIQIGKISLAYLKNLVTNMDIVEDCLSSLPFIIPYLEISNNQEYLIERLKCLTRDCSISTYCSDGGGYDWNPSLPTDGAIIFHFFCVFMDYQLFFLSSPQQKANVPTPSRHQRVFFERYVVVTFSNELDPLFNISQYLKSKSINFGILCTDPMRPLLNFIKNNQIQPCEYNDKNLFYVIIDFLWHVKCNCNGKLNGVNIEDIATGPLTIFKR